MDNYQIILYGIILALALCSFYTKSVRQGLVLLNLLIVHLVVDQWLRPEIWEEVRGTEHSYRIFYLYIYSLTYLLVCAIIIYKEKAKPFFIFCSITCLIYWTNTYMCKLGDKSLWRFMFAHKYWYFVAFFSITTLIDWRSYGILRIFKRIRLRFFDNNNNYIRNDANEFKEIR